MERLRQVRLWSLLFAGVVLSSTGCASLTAARHDMMHAVGLQPPDPPTNMGCIWQNTLAQLPDPTRNGAAGAGLVGQMLLLTAKDLPADSIGTLTVMVEDITPRPPGTPPRNKELYHFDKDTLKKLRSSDEKLGRHYALFLPWPAEWVGVSRVKIGARYDLPDKTTLFSPEADVTLDFSQSTSGPGVPGITRPQARTATAGIPDAGAMMKNLQPQRQTIPVGGTAPQGSVRPQQSVVPATGSAPPAGGLVIPAMVTPGQ